MTERERWIVYPLLFLALGAALRDKLVDRTTTKSIKCQELVVEEEPVGNQTGRVLVKIGRSEATPTRPSIGYFYVKGEVEVDGLLKVDGAINAKQYAYQDVILPFWQPVPGFVFPNTMRIPQPAPQGQPPTNAPKPAPKTAPPSSPADKSSPSDE